MRPSPTHPWLGCEPSLRGAGNPVQLSSVCLQGPPGPRLHLHQDLPAQPLPPAGLAGGLLHRGLHKERGAPGEAPGLPLLPGVPAAGVRGERGPLSRGHRRSPRASAQVLPLDSSAEHLLSLLEVGTERRAEGTPRSADLEDPKEAEDTRPLAALCKRLSEDGGSRKVRPFPGRRGWCPAQGRAHSCSWAHVYMHGRL